MNCPQCGVWSSVVTTINKQSHVQRRRECANGHKFSTEERVVPAKKHGGDRKSRDAIAKHKEAAKGAPCES